MGWRARPDLKPKGTKLRPLSKARHSDYNEDRKDARIALKTAMATPKKSKQPVRSKNPSSSKNPTNKQASKQSIKKPKERTLNVRQERFCELVAGGESQTEAWLKAGYNVSRTVAAVNANEALKIPNVKARIAELRKPQTKEALRKKEDNLRYLAQVIGTPLQDIGPDSILCTEYTEEFIAGGSRGKLKRGQADQGNEVAGPDVIRRRVKKPDPLRAIELYSKLLGHFEPDRVEVETGPKTLASLQERAKAVRSGLNLAPRMKTIEG